MTVKPRAKKASWISEKPESTATRVERQIKEAVLSGKLKAGEVLGSENELAAQFGVSRLPIREALSRLSALGIIEIRTGAGGGARIAESANPSAAIEALALQFQLAGVTVDEVFVAQYTLETAAIPLAAKEATDEELDAIEAAIGLAEAAVNGGERFTRASLNVHQLMVDAAHNHVLSAVMQAVTAVLYRALLKGTNEQTAKGVVKHHRQVLQALRQRDPEAVRMAVIPYLERVRRHTNELFRDEN
ncbi:MAG: FadR family transcriptional regulator [Pigmentiphaga sp.]|nr:FadR family transcriptional regulator [Pigmentiphaga sp.]